jgi:MFS family permease
MWSLLARLPPVRTYREIRRDFDRLVLVLAAGDLVASFGFALVFPFLTIYLVDKLGASVAQAGLVLAAYSVCSIVSGAVGGWLADRVGRRRVMIVSIGLTAVVIALMGQASDLASITVLTIVLGIVDPAFIPAARAAIADVVPEDRRPRAYSLLSVANAVGWITGPAIGAGLATLGYDVVFVISGLIIGLYAVIAFVWLPETLGRRAATGAPPDDLVAEEAPVVVGATPAAAGELTGDRPGAPAETHVGRRTLTPVTTRDGAPADAAEAYEAAEARRLDRARLRTFAVFLPIAAVVHATIFLWVTVLPVHAARDLGIATNAWGLLFSVNGLIIVAFQLRVTSAVEGRPKAFVMAVAMLGYAAGMGVIALLTEPTWAVPGIAMAIVLITVGEILLFPVEPAFTSDLSPVDRRGRYQGYFLAATGVGTAIGPPLGGYLLDAAPGPTLWILASGAFLAASVALALLGRATRSLPSVEGA